MNETNKAMKRKKQPLNVVVRQKRHTALQAVTQNEREQKKMLSVSVQQNTEIQNDETNNQKMKKEKKIRKKFR